MVKQTAGREQLGAFAPKNDVVDTSRQESADFTPFRNIINELYAKDTSKQQQCPGNFTQSRLRRSS